MGVLILIETLRLKIWGRDFSLPLVYDTLSDGVVAEKQMQAFENFKKHLEWIDASKAKVEEYCEADVLDDDNNQKKDNIFSYIKPESIYVDRKKEYPQVAIMCKYKYDPEHGLAVVFEAGGKVIVGIQDIIL